jgi:predicted amidohydrolase YtcJ
MGVFQGRRDFIKMLGAGSALSSAGMGSAAWAAGGAPDMIVINAKVYTVDDAAPRAQAFAVKNGRFLAVGSNDEIKAYAGAGTQTVDAAGATVVPGFNDAHIHADGNEVLYGVLVGNPYEIEITTIDTIIDKLRDKAKTLPANTWVDASFYDDTKVSDGRQLTIADLDKASTTHPIKVGHRGGHIAWYNSKAFELAGITDKTPNPPGGEFFHDKNGKLTGLVAERANRVFEKVGLQETYTPEQRLQRAYDAAVYFSKMLVKYGVTSVQTGARNFEEMLVLQKARAEGTLRHRISYECSGDVLEAMIQAGIQTGFGDDWLKFGSTSEHGVDGSFSGRTMAIKAGYPGTTPRYHGILTEEQDVCNAWVERVHKAGINPNIHANGDLAIERALIAFERAQSLHPTKGWRPKITHCTLINDDLLRRIKAIGAVPAPFTSYTYYNSDKFHYYGKDIMDKSMAFREFIDNGIIAAAGTDYRPGPFQPLMGLQGMVTRKGWDGKIWGANQAVTVAEGLRISTFNGSYATYEDKIKGSITAGKLADFVMLAEDPHTIDPEKIINIKILRTVTDGRTVYEA